ncbi:hypothetical protein V6N11_071711 [Hibiscus sabdariffa]|uniref:Uncharacterized protein n=1 Tax=Hibiscus sabdariffa TaxID=183260 RepID=A0ABR2U0V8_9ROSI
MATSTNKYELLYRKSISGFIEEPMTKNFIMYELCMGSNDSVNCNGGIIDSSNSFVPNFGDNEETNVVYEDKIEECGLSNHHLSSLLSPSDHVRSPCLSSHVVSFAGDSGVVHSSTD